MSPGWAWARLYDVVEVLDTQREPIRRQDRERRCAGKQRSELFPYYGATGQVGWIDGCRSEGSAILLGEDGAPFLDRQRPKAYPVDGRYWVNNHAHILRPRDARLARFLCHQLNQVDYAPYVSGTTRLKLTKEAMLGIPVLVPPADEAERIGVAIDALFADLDEAEAALERVRDALADYRASLLHAACTGALTAAWREANPRPAEDGHALLRRILAERRAAWERAELARLAAKGKPAPKGDAWKARYEEPQKPDADGMPELPDGWIWATVDQLSSSVQYGTSAKCSPLPDGVPVLRMGNIKDGCLDFESLKHLPVQHEEFPDLLLESGDLLFNRTNSAELVGKTAVYEGHERHCSFASYLIRVKLVGVRPHFLSHFINSPLGKAWVASAMTQQVGQANVSGGKLKTLAVPLPPIHEQDEVIATVRRGLEACDGVSGETSCQDAALLRQSILHVAFTGRLVPQDPADEAAAALLARLRAARAASGRAPRRARPVQDALL